MVSPAPLDAILINVTGDITGSVTGDPPNDATGDLDAEVELPNPGWSLVATTWEIADTPDIGAATLNFTTGEWTYTVDPDEFADLDDGEIVFDTFEVLITAYAFTPGGQLQSETETQIVTIGIEGVCFADGTLIDCGTGQVPVENLSVGDFVATADNGLQPIRWIEGNRVSATRLQANTTLWPVRIRAGALGGNKPRRDLVVSQQHRILITGSRVELMFGTDEALVSAKSLCRLPGVEIVKPQTHINYFHILLDRHEILDAEGVLAESLFLGEEALHAMTSDGLQELSAIFRSRPNAETKGFGDAARLMLRDREAVALF